MHVKYRPCSRSTLTFVLVTFSMQHLYTRTFILVQTYKYECILTDTYTNHKPPILTRLSMYECIHALTVHINALLPHVNVFPATYVYTYVCRCGRAWVDCGALPQRSTGWWPPLSVASGPTLTQAVPSSMNIHMYVHMYTPDPHHHQESFTCSPSCHGCAYKTN